MHLPINVKSPNKISKWQVGFNSAFKGLIALRIDRTVYDTLIPRLTKIIRSGITFVSRNLR
jgi:hypothetical protein